MKNQQEPDQEHGIPTLPPLLHGERHNARMEMIGLDDGGVCVVRKLAFLATCHT